MKSFELTNTSSKKITYTDGIETVVFDKNTATVLAEGSVVRMKIVDGVQTRNIHFPHSQVTSPETDDAILLAALLQRWIDNVSKLSILTTQADAADPNIQEVLINDIDDAFEFTRDDVGKYIVSIDVDSPVEFTAKTTVKFSAANSLNQGVEFNASITDNNKILIETLSAGVLADSMLVNTEIEITVHH